MPHTRLKTSPHFQDATPHSKHPAESGRPQHHWTFLTNHAHVLICLARNPTLRMRDLSQLIGITERTVQQVIRDLSKEGYLTPIREGRCNHYILNRELGLRHPIEQSVTSGDLISLIESASSPT
jgi:hypothetical protein